MFKRDKRNPNNWKVNRKTDSDGFYENKSDRHFRGKKVRIDGKVKIHPHYVVGEYPTKYMSFGITHDEYKGKKHKNYHMVSNPNMNDKKDSYMRKQLSCENKTEYSPNVYSELKMSKKDDDYVSSLIRKQKKK